MSEQQPEAETLYERVGGQETIDQLIGAFYGRVLGDPTLAPFFSETAIDKLKAMQTEFFAAALGGPVTKAPLDIAWIHSGRGIQRKHVGLFIDHLVDTMRDMNLDEDDIRGISARISLYVDDVVGTGGHGG